MSEKPSPPRFMVRQGSRDFMVWNRERPGPALMAGEPQVGLTKEEAEAIRDSFEALYAMTIGAARK